MSDDLVAELTLTLRNDMGAGLDEVRDQFSGLDGTLQQLRDVLGGLTEELQAMRAPDGLADGFAGVVSEADAATASVQAIGAAIDEDVRKVQALKDAWAGYGGTGGFGGGMTQLAPTSSNDDGNFRPDFVPPNTPVPWGGADDGGGRNASSGSDGGHGGGGGEDMATNLLFAGIEIATGREAAEKYADFDWILTHIAITENLSGEAADKEKEFLTEALNDLAIKTGTSSTDLANAYSFLVTTGMKRDLIQQLMPSLAETSTAYNIPVEDQVQGVLALNETMGIDPEEMPVALAMLAKAGKVGHFGAADFSRYLPALSTQMKMWGDTGLSGEADLGAALETVRFATGSSEQTATDVGDLINYISSPIAARFFDRTQRSKDLLGHSILNLFEKYHVPDIDIPQFLDDERDKGVSSMNAMVDLARKIYNPDMTPTDQREIFGALFHNSQAAEAAFGLVQYHDKYTTDEALLKGVNPAMVQTDYQTARDTPEVALREMDEQFAQTVRIVGEGLIPTFHVLTDAARGLGVVIQGAESAFGIVTKPLTTAIGTALAYQQHDAQMHYNNPAAPQTMNVHITVGPDGQVIRTLQMGTTPPGVNLRVNQGQVLGAP